MLCNPCALRGREKRGQNQKGLHHPRLLAGPQKGGIAVQPLRSRGSLEEGTKSEKTTSPLPSRGPGSGRNCYATRALSRIPEEGTKSEVATSPLPSRGPRRTHAPRRGDKIRKGYITPAFSGAWKWLELLRNPCPLRDPRKRGQNQK